MLTRRKRGFTLIELLLVIAVMGVLLAVGLPQYAIWAQNLRVRGATEAVQNGLQMARATALARNTQAILVFRPNSLSYFVYTVPNPGTPPSDMQDPDADTPLLVDMVRRHNQADDAGGTTGTFYDDAGLPSLVTYMVTFSPLGSVVANPDGSARLSRIEIKSAAASPDPAIRKLEIRINAGGSTRTCDPQVTDPADLRKCP